MSEDSVASSRSYKNKSIALSAKSSSNLCIGALVIAHRYNAPIYDPKTKIDW